MYAELVMGHFVKTQPNPKFLDPTRPNPTHRRHLVWHIRLYRKLYTTTVTRHRQVHSSQLERKSEESNKNKFVRPRWPYDMRPSVRAEKYMCVIVIR